MKVEDIKFKAKSILDGAWVQGDLIHKEDGKIAILRNGFNVSEVDPSTVCQFTGMKDSEGNEIWEGDVLFNAGSGRQYMVMRSYYGGSFFIRKNGTVDDDMYLFELVREGKGIAFFEVVGNKFDNEK